MWPVVFLCALGLNIHQANGGGKSTQMYYVKLKIEESAIANITEILTPFVRNTNLKVEDLEKTTICQNVSTGTECNCMSGFRWSDKVCQSPPECCGDKKCLFTSNRSHCVSNKTVAIKGSVSLEGTGYINCLKKDAPEEFTECNDKLLREIKTAYSTLRGFDMLTITKYKAGSVIAEFEITIAYDVNPQDLIEKSNLLNRTLSETPTIVLETTGVVQLHMPPSPVCYYHMPRLRCTLKEDLKTPPVWQLNSDGKVFEIFDGTESTVTTETLETILRLQNISQRWEGEYTCAYHQKSDLYTITHKASAKMDIALLPDIHITMKPSFPRCEKSSDLQNVEVKCEIGKSSEGYTVSWKGENNVADISPYTVETGVYVAKTVFRCNKEIQPLKLSCTFKNKCNETRTASIPVNLIYADEKFCEAEGDWEETKAGHEAVLKCKNAAGFRRRKCRDDGSWDDVDSACVNQEVDDVLQKAIIVDTGLGDLNKNAATVFSQLENVTNNSKTINTFANMNASVQVIASLSEKLKSIDNQSSANDFLESSSNLLEKSLNKSWSGADEGNVSLAERYLSSVELLIHRTNITSSTRKKNIEVAASNCSQRSQCQNQVFNVSVVLKSSDPGSVKTTGFKELEKYLPLKSKKKDYEPNSIVVSTTTERKQLDPFQVQIKFQLLKPRPRNFQIQCVAWDFNNTQWSEEGCKWKGSSDEGVCICEHLSSFAILMSRFPVDIEGLTEVTYVGLSISIMSLIISLVIEVIVWSAVVKTHISYLRHTAHVNVSLCLLIADGCFLASSDPSAISEMWCQISVVLKHFCYLSMFFWMLSLSSILLHQAVFPFHTLSKKIQLRLSLLLGYVCPLLIVVITFLTYHGGSEGEYFSNTTCWLLYAGLLRGSIHTFVIPVGMIVFFNVFAMLVVIMKLLNHPMNTDKSNENERKAAVTVMRSVVLLTPIFGVTWIFGFGVMLLDLTAGTVAIVVNYAFTLLNAFQGLFILLTTCLGDKQTREALLNRFKKKAPASISDSTTKLDSTLKK